MKIEVIFIAFMLIGLIFISGCSAPANSPGSAQTPAKETASSNEAAASVNETAMVDCGEIKDPNCFINRMNQCLPVTATMTGSDGSTKIELIILGVENGTCHFQRTVSSNGALNLNCYFPKGTMNWDTIDQTFGNDKGLQKVVDDACKPAGW